MGQMMQMMSGAGNSVGHTIDLRLASRTKPPAAPNADHWIPGGLQMGQSLPLVTPTVTKSEPVSGYKPHGVSRAASICIGVGRQSMTSLTGAITGERRSWRSHTA